MLQRLIPAPIAPPNHHQGSITLQRSDWQQNLGRTGTPFVLSSHTRALRGQHCTKNHAAVAATEARVRTRQFPHAPTPAHTKCASGFARVTTSPDVHVAVRILRRRARTPATSISELSQERESGERRGRRSLSPGSCPAQVERSRCGNPENPNPANGEVSGPRSDDDNTGRKGCDYSRGMTAERHVERVGTDPYASPPTRTTPPAMIQSPL